MSWGKDPSKWGTPVTVRFRPSELESIHQAMKQADLWGGSTLSSFVREAAMASAHAVLAKLRLAGPASDATAAARKTRGPTRRTSRRRTG